MTYSISDVINDYSEKKMESKSVEELNEMLGNDSIESRLLSTFALLKKIELDDGIEQRKKIIQLSNFKNIAEIFDSREEFSLHVIKLLYFLVGNGDNTELRAFVYSHFGEKIFKGFSSFDTVQVAFSLELAIKTITLPAQSGQKISLNPHLNVSRNHLIRLVRSIGEVDTN